MIGPKTERSLLYGGRGWERCCTGRHSTTAAVICWQRLSGLLEVACEERRYETLDRALTTTVLQYWGLGRIESCMSD